MKLTIEKWTYLLYCVSYFQIILNPGIFWDDWAIINMNSEDLMVQFRGNGGIINGYFFMAIKEIWESPILFHFLTFLFFTTTIFFLFKIVKVLNISDNERKILKIIILLISIIPHYDARITVIMLPATTRLTFFVIGSYLLLKFSQQHLLKYRILSLLFFFLSFFTNSFLVFYSVPIFFILFYKFWGNYTTINFKSGRKLITDIAGRAAAYIDFLLLPFLFWIIRGTFFRPSLHYKQIGYNEVKIESLLEIPFRLVKFFYVSLISLLPLLKDAALHYEFQILLLLLTTLIYKYLSGYITNLYPSRNYFLLGVCLLIIAVFPYLMVNKFPSFIAYNSRHQLLMGPALSLIVCSLFLFIKLKKLRRVIFALSISFFVVFNIYLQYGYFKGSMKNEIYKERFSQLIKESESSRTILFKDCTKDFTLKGYPVKFYALAGILKQTSSKQNTMIIREEDLNKYLERGLFPIIQPFFSTYNLANYKLSEPEAIITVRYSDRNKPTFPFFTYYSHYFLGHKEEWQSFFDIDIQPIIKK